MRKYMRRITSFALSFVLAMSSMTIRAEENANTPLQEGEMRLTKKAEPVEGKVNTWKVTVTAEGKDKTKPIDYVIVMDRSGSMLYDAAGTKNKTEVSNSRIVYARSATKELVENIYETDSRNRVAVISYASAPATSIKTDGYYKAGTEHTSLDIGLTGVDGQNAVDAAIDSIAGSRVTGGTYTQLALHQADELMAQAKAEDTDNERDRVIILVTDGRPTLAVGVDWNKVPDEEFSKTNIVANDCHAYTTKLGYVGSTNNVLTNGTGIPVQAFDYENANINTNGYGVDTTYAISHSTRNGEKVYANIKNLTVAEADIIRANNNVKGLYVIGYDVSAADSKQIGQIAGDEDHYCQATGESGISKAMDTILKKSSNPSYTAVVSDEIPVGFTTPKNVEVSSGDFEVKDGKIKWDVGTPNFVREGTDPTERYATLTYELSVDDNVTFVEDEFYKTNGETKITYDYPAGSSDITEKGKTATVESPEVKIDKYSIKKVVVNDENDNGTFTIKVVSPSGKSTRVNVKANDDVGTIITKFTETGTYTISEIVDEKGYSVKYKIDGKETNTFTMETKPITESVIVNIEIENTKKDYDVTYQFKSVDPNETLPQEVLDLLPPEQTDVLNGTSVNAQKPEQTKVTVTRENGGIDVWTFIGYDQDKKTINGGDIQFVGQWAVEHFPPYVVTYEYVSGTPGKELPDEVKILTPEKVKDLIRDDKVDAKQPTKTEVKVPGGKWGFDGYNKNSVTIVDHDDDFVGTWTFVEEKHDVTYEYVSGTEGKELPDEIKNMTPESDTGLSYGTDVNAEQPTQKEVPVEGGKWVFKGYDNDSVTMKDEDEKFTGTWEFIEDDYKVTYEYVSGTEGKELPEEIKNMTPKDVTKLHNKDTVDATNPETYTVSVEGGTWVFEGYDKDSLKINGEDGKFTGTWKFIETTYNITYEYISGTEGKVLPDEVKALTPSAISGVKDGESKDATAPAQTEVVVDGGKWIFQSYDNDTVTIDKADGKFVGTWVFEEEKTYNVTHEYVSGTPGKELPKEIKDSIPDDITGLINGTEQKPTSPTTTEVKVEGGTWKFQSYDKESVTIDNADGKFVGTWVFEEDKTYNVTYEYVSGTPGKDLPDEIRHSAPADVTGLKNGESTNAIQPQTTEVEVEGGKWVFQSYDKTSVTIDNADGKFIGTWVFVEDEPEETFKIIHQFVSGTPGKEIPDTIRNMEPEDITDLNTGTTKNPTQPQMTEVKVDGGTWVFKGYDRDSATIQNDDEEFIGTWEFVEDPKEETYIVTYEYVSGTPGKELPKEIKVTTPVDLTDLKNGETINATQPETKEYKVEGGTWKFESYDKESVTIDNADGKFIGTWVFIEDEPEKTFSVSHRYVSGTPGKEIPDEVKALTPANMTGLKDGATQDAVAPSKTEVKVLGGKWVFKGYDRDSLTIEGADGEFIGVWEFVADSTPTDKPADSSDKTNTNSTPKKPSKTPNTGVENNGMIWMVASIVSISAIIGFVLRRKKYNA